ncbi:MAG: DoxX family protein [Gammaproteobacteria bacterium]|nr:DoxX family protein [Gammaproteobacteria bacterium]
MTKEQRAEYGIVLLRISFGVMLIAHGLILKYFTYGLDGTVGFFQSIGYPGWLAYVVFLMETVGGFMILLGVFTRWASLAMVPIMIGATMVHIGNGWVFSAEGGGWEYPVYLIVLAVAQFLLGSGPYALKRD